MTTHKASWDAVVIVTVILCEVNHLYPSSHRLHGSFLLCCKMDYLPHALHSSTHEEPMRSVLTLDLDLPKWGRDYFLKEIQTLEALQTSNTHSCGQDGSHPRLTPVVREPFKEREEVVCVPHGRDAERIPQGCLRTGIDVCSQSPQRGMHIAPRLPVMLFNVQSKTMYYAHRAGTMQPNCHTSTNRVNLVRNRMASSFLGQHPWLLKPSANCF